MDREDLTWTRNLDSDISHWGLQPKFTKGDAPTKPDLKLGDAGKLGHSSYYDATQAKFTKGDAPTKPDSKLGDAGKLGHDGYYNGLGLQAWQTNHVMGTGLEINILKEKISGWKILKVSE